MQPRDDTSNLGSRDTDPANGLNPPQLPSVPQLSASADAQAVSGATPAVPVIPADTPPKPAAPPLVDPPGAADDNDLIEQEWVDKAKAIVDKTRDNPHAQNEELSKFKADYIKKRYNRDIKITEE